MSPLKNRKKYEFIKSTLEEANMEIFGKLDLKDPDDKQIYDSLCQAIELADDLASRWADQYDNNALFI